MTTIIIVLVAFIAMVWVTAMVIGVLWFINRAKEKRAIDMQNYIEMIVIPELYSKMEETYDKMLDKTIDKSVDMSEKIAEKLTAYT